LRSLTPETPLEFLDDPIVHVGVDDAEEVCRSSLESVVDDEARAHPEHFETSKRFVHHQRDANPEINKKKGT
jgi:hypothetical protein